MRGFSTYFNAYRKGISYNINAEGIPEEVKPVVPMSAYGNDEVESFFAGENIISEEIDTYGTYCYRARMHTSAKCSTEELYTAIKGGLAELGYAFSKFSLTPIPISKPNKEICDYEVFIQVS